MLVSLKIDPLERLMMTLSIILLFGLTMVLLIVIFRHTLFMNIEGIRRLSTQKWFHNHWLSGVFLFFVNASFFGTTALLLYLLTLIEIPFIHILIMIFAVVISILAWANISRSWQGTRKNRFKMGFLGSSFYLLLALIIIYQWINLKPSYPGDDTFMAGIGLLFGFVVSFVAFITCLCFTAFSKRDINI